MSNRYCEKLLSVKINSQLNFTNHLETVPKKASQKVHALARIMPCMCISKRKLFMNTFFKAHFSYCSLVWMCHSRSMNKWIIKLIGYMKDALELIIMIKRCLSRIY